MIMTMINTGVRNDDADNDSDDEDDEEYVEEMLRTDENDEDDEDDESPNQLRQTFWRLDRKASVVRVSMYL